MALQLRALCSALLLLLSSSCATDPPPDRDPIYGEPASGRGTREAPPVRHWGEMRRVLREGRTEGRVDLADVVGPHTVAVGALEGLAGEITVLDGTAHLAQVSDATSLDGVRTRTAADGDRAALLVAADVAEWSEHPLAGVSDLAALEASIRALALAEGIDVSAPFPFRVEGVASELSLHVLNRSCPIASPDGPKPWRFAGKDEAAILVGFHADRSAGILTHHGRQTHAHAILSTTGIAGHLDDVSFANGARVYLPVR